MISLRKDTPETQSSKNKIDIKNVIKDFQNKETKTGNQTTRVILRFIHFYIRKRRYQNPKRYIRNNGKNPNGIQQHDFEDLIQYIFLYLLERIHSIDISYNENQVRAYLNRIIETGYISWMNERKKNIYQECISLNTPVSYSEDGAITAQDIIEDLQEKTTPEIEYGGEELNEKVHYLINSLPPRTADIFRLKYLRDMTQKDIGKIIEISPERVRQVIEECKQALTSKKGPLKKKYKNAKAYYLKLKNAL